MRNLFWIVVAASLAWPGCRACEKMERGGVDGVTSVPDVKTADAAARGRRAAKPAGPRLPQYMGAELAKRDAAAMLKAVNTALREGRSDAIEAYLAVPEGTTMNDLIRQAPSLVEEREISEEGVSVLRLEGKYGLMTEVLPVEHAAQITSRFGPDPTTCMAFFKEPGEAGFCRFDGVWKIVRIDDVGKLTK